MSNEGTQIQIRLKGTQQKKISTAKMGTVFSIFLGKREG